MDAIASHRRIGSDIYDLFLEGGWILPGFAFMLFTLAFDLFFDLP